MTTYGDALYGPPNLYGLQRPVYSVPAGSIALPLISNAYLIDPFVAVATDYSTITLTWKLPDPTTNTPMTEFRLLSNRYGYPVDENDGAVLVDVTSVQEFGGGYLDQSVIPGTFHYYAVYINTGSSWVRAGFAACLMPASNGYGSALFNLLPEYLRDIIDAELTQTPGPSQVISPQVQPSGVTVSNPYAFPVQITLTGGTITDVVVDGVDLGPSVPTFWMAGTGNVTVYYSATPSWTWLNVPAGGANSFLQQFLAVAGWSLDYLKTQYDYTLDSLNDPMLMPLSDLVQLCDELGLPFSPEVPAYFMRKAAANWAVIMQQRGSVAGIAEHASVLSGYELDLQTSSNLMLENDQSAPQSPRYPWWSPSITYIQGERVLWGPFTSVPPEWSPNRTYPSSVSVLYGGLVYQSAEAVPANIPPNTSGTYWTQLTGPYLYQALAGNLDTMPTGSVSGSADWGLLDNRDNYGKYAGLDDSPSAWASGSAYAAGDRVTYPVADGTVQSYMCLVANTGSAPSGTTAATTHWLPVYDNLVIQNSALAGRHAPSTWEALYPNEGASYSGAAYSLVESIGLPNPLAYSFDWSHNGFRAYNMSGTASEAMWLRSLLRQASDVSSSNTNLVPDPQLVIQHGIPVPEAVGEWSSSTRYTPGDVVSYAGINYQAQRASTGAAPPEPKVPLNENWDFEGSVTPWASDGLVTVTDSTAFAHHGSSSMELTYTGTENAHAASEFMTVIPGATYLATGWVYSPAAGTDVSLALNWQDSFGNYINGDFASFVSLTAGTWTQVTAQVTMPGNATVLFMAPTLLNPGTGSYTATAYWDQVTLTCLATPEWLPVGLDSRIPLMISADFAQSNQQSSSIGATVTPFVEWYDNWGNFISRVFARTTTAGTAGMPSSYIYDSFRTGPNTVLAGRETDTQNQTWTTVGSWLLDGSGSVYPTSGVNPLAWVTAPLSCTQAVTFTEAPQSGEDTGLIFWRQASGVYWHAGTHGLYYYNNSTWAEAVTYATAGQLKPGDRVYVVTNQAATGSASAISVYRNLVQAYNSTTGNGLIATVTATGAPSGSVPASGTTVFSGIASEAV